MSAKRINYCKSDLSLAEYGIYGATKLYKIAPECCAVDEIASENNSVATLISSSHMKLWQTCPVEY
jgi:hypothetical protein